MIEVVLARHREDTAWTNDLHGNIPVVIYTKGKSLPNLGREAATYLHHIIIRHMALLNWTIFSQADPFPHVPNFVEIVNGLPARITPFTASVFLGNREPQEVEEEGWGHRWRDANREIWSELYTSPCPKEMKFVPGAIFAVSRETLVAKSPAFYLAALQLVVSRPKGPWEFERFWPLLWHPDHHQFARY